MNTEFVKLLSLSDSSLKDEAAEIMREARIGRGGSPASPVEQKGFMASGILIGVVREESELAEFMSTAIQSFREVEIPDAAHEYWDGCRRLAVDMPEGAAMRLAAIAFREKLTKAGSEGKLWKTQKVPPGVAEKASALRRAVLQKRSPVSYESMLQQLEVFQAARDRS